VDLCATNIDLKHKLFSCIVLYFNLLNDFMTNQKMSKFRKYMCYSTMIIKKIICIWLGSLSLNANVLISNRRDLKKYTIPLEIKDQKSHIWPHVLKVVLRYYMWISISSNFCSLKATCAMSFTKFDVMNFFSHLNCTF